MTDAIMLIQLIIRSIGEGDSDSLQRYLGLVPINQLSIEKGDSLLRQLLAAAFEYSNQTAARAIVETFEPNYMDRYQLPILNQILVDLKIDDEIAAMVLRQFPEYSYSELANNFIKYQPTDEITTGLLRLEKFKGPAQLTDYRLLFKLAHGEGNYVAEDFFALQLDRREEFAVVPPWVKNFLPGDQLPHQRDLVIPPAGPEIFDLDSWSVDQLVEFLTGGLKAAGKSWEEIDLAQNNLRIKLTGATTSEKREIIYKTLQNKARADLANDLDYFRLFGPANLIYDEDLTDDDRICCRYGGCRMLTCLDFEDFMDPSENIIYPLEDYSPYDWFTGACQQCHRRIQRYAHAIRIPLEQGGWKGCFCSAECIREYLQPGEGVAESIDANPLIYVLLDRTVDELNRWGLQDRLP